LNALVFMYREVLKRPIEETIAFTYSQKAPRIPTVFSHQEASAVLTQLDARHYVMAALLYGAGLRVRAQRDKFRRGFGGRVGDCPAGNPACASVVVGANTRGVKGHTGQFYTDGAPDTEDTALGLEGAYLFLRTSYGDFVAGRDDGSAYLFSLGAPSLVAVAASNSGVDYTGLDSVKTFNDASGYAEKIAYTSPRLLGDQIGVGVQVGASYAFDAKACGVNYCVRDNSPLASEVFAPEMKNIVEIGLSLDRKFDSGLSAEFTTTYARGSEKTGNAAFTNLSAWGAGLELKYADFVFGTSYLKSNNGFAGNGDYTAYDVGVTWKPSNWGYSASYGHATDDIARLSSDQGVLAVSYDFGRFRLGSGVQYIHRKVPFNTAGVISSQTQNATALFIEGGIKF
ncbi:MAG: porin, partial [Robiginitomaculum sp.]|nr:porin [Robiginitomaculum sp.]